jgi:serpin B
VDAILEGVNYQEVALAMPKFEVESDFSLADMLTAMGMPVAFSTDADFSGMDGTEAAAATAVVVARMGLAQEAPIEMTVDHPFVFLIRDLETNTILFLGRVLDPRA